MPYSSHHEQAPPKKPVAEQTEQKVLVETMWAEKLAELTFSIFKSLQWSRTMYQLKVISPFYVPNVITFSTTEMGCGAVIVRFASRAA